MSTKEAKERIGNLFVLIGKQQDTVESAKAGDIVLVAKLHETATMDTLSTARTVSLLRRRSIRSRC